MKLTVQELSGDFSVISKTMTELSLLSLIARDFVGQHGRLYFATERGRIWLEQHSELGQNVAAGK